MKGNKFLIKLAIVCIAMSDAGTGATTPALGSIVAAFPHVSPSLVQMIASIPALFIALIPPVYAKLIEFMRKKTLLYIAGALFIIGGVAPAIFNTDIWVILAFRALIGIACGILLPMSTDLAVDFFDGKERSSMLGFVSATVGLSGIMFQLLGGYLAAIGWQYCFYSYLISIIFFIISFILLPEPNRKAKIAELEGSSESKAKVPGSVYLNAILFGLFYLFWYVVPTNGAIVILSNGLGQPGVIGIVFSLMTVGSFVCSIIFGQVFKAMKFYLLPISYALLVISLYLCYTGQTLTTFTIGIIVAGFAMGFAVPATMAKLTGLVPYSAASKAISFGFFGMGIGGFIQPMVFGALNIVPGRAPYLVGAIAMVVLTILVFIVDKATPTKVAPPQEKASK